MLNTYRHLSLLSHALRVVSGAMIALALIGSQAAAQVLVNNPFVHSYTGWVDAFPPPTRAGNWRLSLHNPTLMDTNNANPPSPDQPSYLNTGIYEPDVLFQNGFAAPATYDLNATMRTNDDDIIGLVWNYQDPNNYFRVGIRQQAAGSFGGTQGLSVQKIVNGTLTQLIPSTPMAGPASPITQAMIDGRTPFNMKVAVNGSNYEIFFDNVSVGSGSDPDLVAGRKIGIQSWAQQTDADAVTPSWGTEVETISVTQGANTLYSQSFAARPIKFRQLTMTNSAGVSGLSMGASKAALGTFGLAIDHPWVLQHTNGNINATAGTPNVDFIGPAVVVDEPGAASMTNYQLQTRFGASDNDGVGVIVRAQDDNNFYRITFHTDAAAIGTTRPPRGLTVQKNRNGVWSQLFHDPTYFQATGVDTNPLTPDTGVPMHDLTVGVVGNQIKIQLRDNLGVVRNFPIITDSSDPILSGSAGFHTWGNSFSYFMSHGGDTDSPLITALSQFTALDAVIDRGTGNITLTNNGASPLSIKGISILSNGGGLNPNPANWLSVSNNYDRPSPPTPGNGTVDGNDAWTITSNTNLDLSEAELTGDGGSIAVGQSINFGNAWIKSRFEDVSLEVELTAGGSTQAAVVFSGGPNGVAYNRSDLNTDGMITAADWSLFFPNMLTDMSALTDVAQALAGDVDGDGDNDVIDFSIFKSDFDAVNGSGSFQNMLAGVPEPTTMALLVAGGLGILCARRRHVRKVVPPTAALFILTALVNPASAVGVDLTTYGVEQYSPAATFAIPNWTRTPTTAFLNTNADANVLFSPANIINKRILGTVRPGTDDDVIGFVLGFEPGDAQIGSSADYMLIDWKGASQNFDFADADPVFVFHHDQTTTGNMPVGLALSRVTGSPTADELWQHVDAPENPTGGVTELARGATLGSTAYNRTNGTHLVDITYTPTQVRIVVDGLEQINQAGSFPDGRFGIYSAWQGPTATWSNFEVVDIGYTGLSATVDRGSGQITLNNGSSSVPVEFDYYQFDSPSNSLNTGGWNSLTNQNHQPVGAGPGQHWQEAGGSDSGSLAEVYLQSNSTLAGGASPLNLGNAFTPGGAEDLLFRFRLPGSGLILTGAVNYIGVAPGLPGDFNDDGKVDAADYVVWRKNGANPLPNDNGLATSAARFSLWKANFGNMAGSGGGAGSGGSTQVPEPASLSLLFCAALMATALRCGVRRTL